MGFPGRGCDCPGREGGWPAAGMPHRSARDSACAEGVREAGRTAGPRGPRAGHVPSGRAQRGFSEGAWHGVPFLGCWHWPREAEAAAGSAVPGPAEAGPCPGLRTQGPRLPKDPWSRPSLSSSGWSCRDRPPAGFVWQRLQLLWGDAGRTIAGLRGESTLSSAGSRHTVPQSGCPGPRPHQPWARLPAAPRPYGLASAPRCLCWISAVQTGAWRCLVVSVCIPLTAYAKHLFVGALPLSYSVRCLFRSFAHFFF